MDWDFWFFLNSIFFGVGLAMDAFSVSVTNGLNEPAMRRRKMAGIALTFAVYQALMPMIGWFCVHNLLEQFQAFEKFIPWIALILLSYIGGKMLYEGIRHKGDNDRRDVDRESGEQGDLVKHFQKRIILNAFCKFFF